MRCEPVSDDEETMGGKGEGDQVRIVKPTPLRKPGNTQPLVPAKRPAQDLTPGPLKKRATRKKPAPAPAPAPTRPVKRKGVKTPEMVPSNADESSGAENWPASRRTFASFENYYGKLFSLSQYSIINEFSRCSYVKDRVDDEYDASWCHK